MSKSWTNGVNCQKYAKIRDVKILQDIPFDLKLYTNLLSNPRGGFLALEAEEPKKWQIFKKKLKKQVLTKNC